MSPFWTLASTHLKQHLYHVKRGHLRGINNTEEVERGDPRLGYCSRTLQVSDDHSHPITTQLTMNPF